MALANALAILLYLGCSVVLLRQFLQKPNLTTSNRVSTHILALLALIFHATDLFFIMKYAGGWDLGLLTTLTLASWFMALCAFLYGLRPINSPAHPGIVIYPLAMITLVLKDNLHSSQPSVLVDPALEWHILLSLASYSLFTLAAIQAVVLAFQEKQLRKHQLTSVFRKLPPLQTLENGLFQLLTTGFLLLSTGLITGAIFINDLFAQHLVHKTVLSLVAWWVFAVLLWGRYKHGWRGTTAVKWTLVGFFFLLLAYFGTKLVLEYIFVPVN